MSFDDEDEIDDAMDACTVCGCTDDDPCMTSEGPCSWVSGGLCSACVPPALARDAEGFAFDPGRGLWLR
jgi:hypothetical protein